MKRLGLILILALAGQALAAKPAKHKTAKAAPISAPQPVAGPPPAADPPPAAGPAADAGAPAKIPDTLSPSEIAPRMSIKGIVQCAKGKTAARSLAITITIAPTGLVTAVKIAPKLEDAVQDCIKKLMDNIKFPKFKGKPVTARFQYKI
jgi:hypothetical protein